MDCNTGQTLQQKKCPHLRLVSDHYAQSHLKMVWLFAHKVVWYKLKITSFEQSEMLLFQTSHISCGHVKSLSGWEQTVV